MVRKLTKSSDNPTHDEMRDLVRSALQDSTDDHDGGASEDGLPPAKPVTNPDGGNSTEQTSQVIRGDGDSLGSQSGHGLENSTNLVRRNWNCLQWTGIEC